MTVAPVRELRFVPLDELRTMPELVDCKLLARGNRLSVLPLTEDGVRRDRGARQDKRRR